MREKKSLASSLKSKMRDPDDEDSALKCAPPFRHDLLSMLRAESVRCVCCRKMLFRFDILAAAPGTGVDGSSDTRGR